MSLTKILGDWSEYDEKKTRDQSDAKDFACFEPWEVDYLTNKIRSHYPLLPESIVRNTIQACCQALGASHPRKEFVKCVTDKMGISGL